MIQFAALWLLVHVAGRLPARILDPLAATTGTIAWYASRRIREVTTDHARHSLGLMATPARVDATALASARAAALYYADFARAGGAPPEPIADAVVDFHGIPALFEAVDAGRGVILVSAHLGNPEMVVRALAPFGLCLAAMTEPLASPRVHEFVHRIRARGGVPFIPATSAGLRAVLTHLHRGGTLAMLVDRDVLGTAAPRPFFEERAPMPSGAVELAGRTGAPMFAVWVPRVGPGRYRVIVEPVPLPSPTGDREADVEAGMRALVAALEAGIRRWPGQWFPLSPIWGQATPTGTRASSGSVE
ncbi:MAG: lysophospholipid acyltransferase family protein [Dehalococcoidia bacterium]|nr:lysophospholipid acyltransferase family protein [Dehalococcoidia bacterium]